MAHGIASGGSLKALAHPIQGFVTTWGAKQQLAPTPAGSDLPAPCALAALRGEGLLRQRFFGDFIPSLPVQLDAAQQIALWQDLVEEGGLITAWVQRLGVARALYREAALPAQVASESRLLYTVLLQALADERPALLAPAAEGYFLHCWKARFAQATPSTDRPSRDPQVLRERLLRQLRRSCGAAVELKESFVQEEHQVRFSLLTRPAAAQPWQTLVMVERPRLKSARVAAYEVAATETQPK